MRRAREEKAPAALRGDDRLGWTTRTRQYLRLHYATKLPASWNCRGDVARCSEAVFDLAQRVSLLPLPSQSCLLDSFWHALAARACLARQQANVRSFLASAVPRDAIRDIGTLRHCSQCPPEGGRGKLLPIWQPLPPVASYTLPRPLDRLACRWRWLSFDSAVLPPILPSLTQANSTSSTLNCWIS